MEIVEDGINLQSILHFPFSILQFPIKSSLITLLPVALAACQSAPATHENALIDLWAQNTAAFGVYVPNENPPTAEQRRNRDRPPPVYTKEGGERLAQNPLYDFVFLNLEGAYDVGAVSAIAEGLRSPTAVSRKTLLVRA